MTAAIKAYTVDEVCQLLGVCRRTLQRMRKRGDIRATRIGAGHRLRYRETEIEAYLRKRTR